MNSEQTAEEKHLSQPVLLIKDSDGYIISAGKPDCHTGKELAKHIKDGDVITTITLREYKEMLPTAKWIYDKLTPTTHQTGKIG